MMDHSDTISNQRSINPYRVKKKNKQVGNVHRIRVLTQYFPKRNNKDLPASQIDPSQAVPANSLGLDATTCKRQRQLTFSKEENSHWGDSIEHKEDDATRLYFQNINGLQASNHQSLKWPSTVDNMDKAGIDIAGFAETNTNWSKKSIKRHMTAVLRSQFEHSSIATSRNEFKSSSSFLPGGTMMTSIGHWTARVIDQVHDPENMGRWCGHKLRLHDNKIAYVVTAYRPVKSSSTDIATGIQTVSIQQHLMFRRKGVEAPKPRQHFIDDLIIEIKKWQTEKNASIIIMLDANETLGEESRGISHLLKQTGLVDVFSRHHCKPAVLKTCIKSVSRRIDFIFATENVLPYILKCGYLPFYDGFDSDHRGLFLDLDKTWIDGTNPLGIQLKRHISTSCHKKEILKYKQYIQSQFTMHNIQKRADDLYNQSGPDMEQDHDYITKLNTLDQQVLQIGLQAEQVCCVKKPQNEWSPPLQQATLVIQYWILVLRGIKNNIDITLQLSELRSKLTPEHKVQVDSNNKKPFFALRLAKLKKLKLIKDHKELRQEYLDQRIQADADKDQITTSQATLRIRYKANCTKLYKELREVFHQGTRSGITHLLVPDRDKHGEITDDPDLAFTWKSITVPDDIEYTLLERSIKHFGQGQGSVFTIDPLASDLGYEGTTTAATQLTSGHNILDASRLSIGAIHILKRLANNEQLPSIEDEITFEEFWKGIRIWSESTSTSPSRRHLGHYKVLQTSDGNDSLYNDVDKNPSTEIMLVYYQIAMSAIRSGQTLTRWCQSTTTMIEKQPGIPKINKLRVIHLYEADYNLVLKILWARKLVWNAHTNDRLNDGQAGSRPGRRAIDIVVQKEMKYLYARLTRSTLASMDNDAKSCYDRIICNLAMMVSKYYGMTTRCCKTQSKTLKQMQFRLRTALGESTRSYAHNDTHPIHGTGQGSCASPGIWLIISCLLIDCLEDLGGGMTLGDVQNLGTIKQWLDGFVDDTSLFTNLPCSSGDPQDIALTALALENDTIQWAQLLEASGGQLELTKCFYYILAWKFSEEGDPTHMTNEEINDKASPISFPNSTTNERILITQKEVSSAHKTLGVWKTMMGCESEQTKVLQEKSDMFAAIVKSANLSRRQARIAYSTIYVPAMSYSLVALNLNETTLDKIQRKAVDAFLPAMGYDHSFPRSIVYGPRDFGGINMCHLYTEQCITKIGTFISHVRSNTTLGKIMKLNLDWTQRFSGRGKAILESNDNISYIADNWFIHFREYLLTIQGTITVDNAWVPVKERIGDIVLMDAFHEVGLMSSELRLVNNWRMYFKVTLLSDITNASGTTILPVYRKRPMFNKIIFDRKSKENYPYQQEPGPRGWRIWMKCIKNCLNSTVAGKLQNPLGAWLITPQHSRSLWNTYMSTTSNKIYVRDDLQYIVYSPTYTRKHTCRYNLDHPAELVDTVPHDSIPVDLYKTSNRIATIDHRNIKGPSTIPIPNITTFDQYILNQPAWSQDLLDNWSSVQTDKLIPSISNSSIPLLLVSDGGLKNDQGSYGIVIGTEQEIIIQNSGIAHGIPALLSSYRSESYGLLCGLHTLISIIEYYRISVPSGKILQLFTDNLGLVSRLSKHLTTRPSLKDCSSSDIDLELQILYEIQALKKVGFIISLDHVKGHQDDFIQFKDLSRQAQLNVAADTLATEAYDDMKLSVYCSFPATKIMLYSNEGPITSKQKETLRSAYLSQPLRDQMVDKNEHWTQHTPTDIWWSIHGKSLKALQPNDRMRIQKFIHDRLPTNKRRSHYSSHLVDTCSVCLHTTEDENHILCCLSPSRQLLREKWISSLDRFMSNNHTHPAVRQAILLGLTSWLEHKPIPGIRHAIPTASDQLIKAFEQQTQIGWGQFIRGRISQLWLHLSQYQLDKQHIDSKEMTTEKWGTHVISINWEFVLQLWEQRNSEEHGDTADAQAIITKRKLLSEAAHIQETQLPISYVDRDLLYRSLSVLENYSVTNLLAWLRNARYIVTTYNIEYRKDAYHRKNNTIFGGGTKIGE